MTAIPVVQRIVPGAPPSIELSKSQKKKRKAAKADDSQSPVAADPADNAHAHAESNESPPGLMSRAESQAAHLLEDDQSLKQSPIADLMNKRLKAMAKKIARVSTYAATDIEKLNDDQVRSLKNLPTLEAIHKEIGEVKKAIDLHEQELAQDLAVKRLEVEKAEKARISNAVSDMEASLFLQFNDVLDVLRVHSLLSSGALDLSSLAVPSEISALFSISNILIGDSDRNQSIVEQIIRGVGEFEGTSYTRLLAITQQALNPPLSPSPVPEELVDEEQPAPPSVDEEEEHQPPVTGIPNASSMTGSFQFIQQSELEAASFEGASEWVDAAAHEPEAEGVSVDAEPATATLAPETGNGTIDWADEEGGLPSIAGLQAEFGNSGSVTPAEAEKVAPEGGATETSWQTYGEPNANGDAAAAEMDDDGFTQAKGRARARGAFRGERGNRGGRGGGERGHRGGDRGFRGGRGDRGGYRGGRGGSEWRGDNDHPREGHGEWGGDRDRGSGDGERGDGDRGRGRGRGFGRGRGGEGGRGMGEGRGRGRRGGRGDRGGHHHETPHTPA